MPKKKPAANLTEPPIPDYIKDANLGDLIVTSGQTVNLNGGVIYKYDNIDIQSGGTLNITGTSTVMTQLAAKISFNISGTINARSLLNNGYSRSGNFISGIPYSYSVSQRAGGRGGQGHSEADGAKAPGGGPGSSGYGGGGGGGASGGTGGTNNAPGSGTVVASGGAGNSTLGAGQVGQTGFGSSGSGGGPGGGSGGGAGATSAGGSFKGSPFPPSYTGGGGGGGGYKGRHGKLLYLMCSFEITGNGFVNCSGSGGFNGANGAGGQGESAGAGGGGGGAGGSGGHLYVQAPGFQPSRSVGGGGGGARGNHGPTRGTSGGEVGYQALNGQTGNSGTYILETDTFRTS